MGVKTYSEFQATLLFDLQNRDDLDSYKGEWINDAYIDLCTRDKFYGKQVPKKFMFPQLKKTGDLTTVDGTSYVSVPSDCLHLYHIWDTDADNKLKRFTMPRYLKKVGRASSTSEGSPTHYVRYGSYIYLWPTPDDAYTLTAYYRYVPDRMTEDADVTDIGVEWDEVIQKLAAVKASTKLRDMKQREVFKEEFFDLLEGRLGIYDNENFDREDTINPDYQYLKTLREP